MNKMRAATHAGSWYSDDPLLLKTQLAHWFDAAEEHNTRFAIGPHAGLSFCGEVLAKTYKSIPKTTEKIVLMGPSHFEYFEGMRTTNFKSMDTPFGSVSVDPIVDFLIGKGVKCLNPKTDLQEHSWEMHLPFIKTIVPHATVIPLLFGHFTHLNDDVLDIFKKLLKTETVAFVISSDFCHYGPRFDYTPFRNSNNISESIERLDMLAIKTLQNGSHLKFKEYLNSTQNTICGQLPILFLLELANKCDLNLNFMLLQYKQSSKVLSKSDNSVSYAALINK